jgi:hypothetical protein
LKIFSTSLPDTIDDEWIEDIEDLGEEIDKYIEKRAAAKNVFEIRYQGDAAIDPDKDRWELCERVLARQELVAQLSEGW